MDSLFRPTGILKENQLVAFRRVVMLQDLYGDKIGRGFMDEMEILGHSEQRMWREMTSLFRTRILKVGQVAMKRSMMLKIAYH